MEVDEYEAETVKKIIEIALMSVQSSPAMRPAMSDLVLLLKTKNLSSVKEECWPPTRPVFVYVNQKPRPDTSASTASSSTTSNATTTITRMSGR